MIRIDKRMETETDLRRDFTESMNKGMFQIMEDLLAFDYKEYLDFVDEVNFHCQKHNIKLKGISEGYRVWSRINHDQVHVYDIFDSNGQVELVDPDVKEIHMAEFLMKYVDNINKFNDRE
jgi:hypothetical protein